MTLIAIAGIPPRAASTLHMVGVLIIAVGVEYNRTGLLVFIIPFGLGVVIPVSKVLFSLYYHYRPVPTTLTSVLINVFSGNMTLQNYFLIWNIPTKVKLLVLVLMTNI